MWLALICFHLVGLVGFNLLLRHSVKNKINGLTLATLAQTGIAVPAVVLLIVAFPKIGSFTPVDFVLICLAVALTIALQITNVNALKYLEASVYAVLYNLRIILTTILGIVFLHETFIWLRVLGGILILLAIFVVKQQSSHDVRLKGVMWGIAAATVLSFLNLTEKELINKVGFLGYFPASSVIAAILMWSYLLSSKQKLNVGQLLRPRMIQLMTLRAVSAYGFSGALAAGALVSVANYISGMSVIVTVLLGAILLGERDYLGHKIAAAVIAASGLTLILLSHI